MIPARGGAGCSRLDLGLVEPWGMREFGVVDPSGNLLRIGQSIRAPD